MPYTYEYPRPMVTVDSIVLWKDYSGWKLLLIKRKNEPYQNLWAFPGGFVEMDESLEAAAARELEEETGMKNIPLEQFKTFGDTKRDPRGRNISVVYYGITSKSNVEIRANDDAVEVQWFPITELPDLAFDHEMIFGMFKSRILANYS